MVIDYFGLTVFFFIGTFAAWRLTWDLTSCTPMSAEGKPDWCEYNLEGPFRLYDGIRWLFRQNFWPKWVRDGIACPYCTSFWFSHLAALCMPIYNNLTWSEALKLFFLMGFGMSGVIIFWFRRVKILYGLSATEI